MESIIIGIAGGAGSGKSTFTNRIKKHFGDDVGIGLMTIFNIIFLYPLSGQALNELKEYEAEKKNKKDRNWQILFIWLQ